MRAAIVPLVIVVAMIALPVHAGERPITDREKTEALISRIERLDGAVFIRNGKEHSARTAANFLRAPSTTPCRGTGKDRNAGYRQSGPAVRAKVTTHVTPRDESLGVTRIGEIRP
jgi:hypothetical protein